MSDIATSSPQPDAPAAPRHDRPHRLAAVLGSPWWEWGALALAFASVAVVAAAGVVALPPSVDGGWYSYPSFAWSLGRDPFSNHFALDAAQRLQGLAAIFSFETTSSVRLFYATPWFAVFGGSWLSLKALSLVELAVAAALAYLLFRTVFRDRALALLTTALLLTDKTLVLGAATDFRPDIALLAGGCALFVVLYGGKGEAGRTVGAALIAAWVAGVALTAAITLSAVLGALGFRALREPEHRRARLIQLGIVGVVALLAFAGRQGFFLWLLDPTVNVTDPLEVDTRITHLLEAGPAFILAKEAWRLQTYFWVSNAPLLLAIGFLVVLLFLPGRDGRRVPGFLVAPLLGLAAGFFVLAVLDPHPASQHMLSLMPFVLLMAGKLERLPSRLPRVALAGLVGLSALASIAVGGRHLVAAARHPEESNAWREAALEALFTQPKEHLVLGPVELWPLLPTDREIVLADLTRTAERVPELDVPWGDVDYVMLNHDYDVRDWVRSLEAATGHAPCPVIERPPFLLVLTPAPCPPIAPAAAPSARVR